MATLSSILAWEIPWTEEPGGLHSMGSQRVGHDLATEQQQHPKLDVVSNISTLKISRMEILVNCLDLFTREAL